MNGPVRIVIVRICVSVWAAFVGSLAAAAAMVLDMAALEIVLAGIINGAGAAVYVYFSA
jgi:hypothetical protein